MNDFPRWKYVLVAVLLLLGILYGVPNLFPQQPALQITANRGATVDEALKEKAQGVLEKGKIPYQRIELTGEHVVVRFNGVDDQTKASDALRGDLGDSYIVALNLASTVP
ncbi:MAG TPA: protein translocase subunit SecD, partial [Rhodanobacteraceae bacterium]|nr:protein translocase subunit SecD [Rhodanobacteraceae bacterium]